MPESIVSMHAAHRSGKEVIDSFLSRPSAGGERPAIVLIHGYRGLDDGQRAVTRRFAQERICLPIAGSFPWQDVSHAGRLCFKENFARYSSRCGEHCG